MALPYGETPWVRFTAVATDDGSAGVQFGITDFTVTQYDATASRIPSACATPWWCLDRHRIRLSRNGIWDPSCSAGPAARRAPRHPVCGGHGDASPEEPVNLSRTLTVPSPTEVTPTVWVRPRQGPNLADLISAPGAARALGDADPIDVLGSAYAAADGDPGTAWTAPQGVVQHKTAPTLTLKLPAPTRSRRDCG